MSWRFATALALLTPLVAGAETPIILVDGNVAQYRQAANAVKRSLGGAAEVSPSASELPTQLSGASVIVAIGQQAFSAAQRAAPTKPVVYCLALGTGVASSQTVTGIPMEADPAVVFGHIRALSPSVKRVGLLYNRAGGDAFVAYARKAAAGSGLELVAAGVASPEQVKPILGSIAGRIDALWLPPEPRLFNREVFSYVLSTTSERKLPLFAFLDSFTEAGAFASVSPDYEDIGFRAGKLAAEIVARSAEERTPVPPPVFAPGRLSINVKTAQALGITVPEKALSQAKQVYR